MNKTEKKLVHLDSTFNKNPTQNPYDQCTLSLVAPIHKPKSISLKSVEMPLVLPTLQVDQNTQTIPFSIQYPTPYYKNYDDSISLSVYTADDFGIVPPAGTQYIPLVMEYPVYPISISEITNPTLEINITRSDSAGKDVSTSHSIPIVFTNADDNGDYNSSDSGTSHTAVEAAGAIVQQRPITKLLADINFAIDSYFTSEQSLFSFRLSFVNNRVVATPLVEPGKDIVVSSMVCSPSNVFKLLGGGTQAWDVIQNPSFPYEVQYNLDPASITEYATFSYNSLLPITLSNQSGVQSLSDIATAMNNTLSTYIDGFSADDFEINNYSLATLAYFTLSFIPTANELNLASSLSPSILCQIRFRLDGLDLPLSNTSLIKTLGFDSTSISTFSAKTGNLFLAHLNPITGLKPSNYTVENETISLNPNNEYLSIADWLTSLNDSFPNTAISFSFDETTHKISCHFTGRKGNAEWDYMTWQPSLTLQALGFSFPTSTVPPTQPVLDRIIVATGYPWARPYVSKDPVISVPHSLSIPYSTLAASYGDMATLLEDINAAMAALIATERNGTIYPVLNVRPAFGSYTLSNFSIVFASDPITNHVQATMSVRDPAYINLWAPDGFGQSNTLPINTHDVFPIQLTLGSSSLLSLLGFTGRTHSSQTSVNGTRAQYVVAPSFYQVSINSYVSLYISNLPIPTSSAAGLNQTFKIPLNNQVSTKSISNVIGQQSINSYYYNEETQFRQKVQIKDSNFVLDKLVVSVCDRTGNILTNDQISWSMTIEVEYET